MSFSDPRLMEIMLSNLSEIIFIIGYDGKISFANPAFEKNLRYNPQEVPGLDPHTLNPTFSAFLEAARTEGRLKRQTKLKKLERGQINVQMVIVYVQADEGDNPFHLVMAENITQLSLLQRQLSEFQRMVTIVEVIKGVSHELSRELSLIYTILGQVYPGIKTPDIKDFVRSASSACMRAAGVVNNLRSLGQKAPPARETIFVYKTIRGLVDSYASTLFRRIEFSIICPDQSIKIEIDPGEFQQVMLNVFINAKEALAGCRNPHINVKIGMEKVTGKFAGASGDKYVYIVISDNGMGMDDETLEKAFYPDFSTKASEGRGLGLNISNNIINRYGGWIKAKSSPGAGSSFIIHLPATDKVSTREIDGLHSIPEGTETVLFFEDNTNLQRSLEKTINRFGYTVIPVNLLEFVLEEWDKHKDRIQIVIFSLIDEHQYLQVLDKIIDSNPNIKILVTVYNTTPEMLGRFGDSMIEYPYTHQQLLTKMRRILDL